MDRTNPPSAHDSAPDWRQMCVAALREPDRKNLPMRIAEAEKAVYCFDRWLLDRVTEHKTVFPANAPVPIMACTSGSSANACRRASNSLSAPSRSPGAGSRVLLGRIEEQQG